MNKLKITTADIDRWAKSNDTNVKYDTKIDDSAAIDKEIMTEIDAWSKTSGTKNINS